MQIAGQSSRTVEFDTIEIIARLDAGSPTRATVPLGGCRSHSAPACYATDVSLGRCGCEPAPAHAVMRHTTYQRLCSVIERLMQSLIRKITSFVLSFAILESYLFISLLYQQLYII